MSQSGIAAGTTGPTAGAGTATRSQPCPHCWHAFIPIIGQRMQCCTRCGGISYFHAGERDPFPRYLERSGEAGKRGIGLLRQEQAMLRELDSLERDIVEQRRLRQAESSRATTTRRILALTMLILLVSAVMLFFFPTPARQDQLVMTLLFSLATLVVMLFIILGANRRANSFHLDLLEEEVRRRRALGAELTRQIDLTLTGTSKPGGR